MEKEKKRLLILGSIPYLIDAVQKAQKRGIEVYVADNHDLFSSSYTSIKESIQRAFYNSWDNADNE